MKRLESVQTKLSINRWHKVAGDNVWDDVKVKEIPIDDALIIAEGLYRGNRGDGRYVADTYSELRTDPKVSDAGAVEHMNRGIRAAYHGINTINTPTTNYATGGGGTVGA